jgi:hypothetical protein
VIEHARSDPGLRNMIDAIRARRYSQEAKSFEDLLWLLAANAICTGARLGLRARDPTDPVFGEGKEPDE